jgi:hypothetical protein
MENKCSPYASGAPGVIKRQYVTENNYIDSNFTCGGFCSFGRTVPGALI